MKGQYTIFIMENNKEKGMQQHNLVIPWVWPDYGLGGI